MESKENKDLDGFVKRKLDELPVEYKEAHWDKAFIVLEAALPLLPKTNWFWWLGGADLVLLAGSATWIVGSSDQTQIASRIEKQNRLTAIAPQEIVVSGPQASKVSAVASVSTKESKNSPSKKTFFAFNSEESKTTNIIAGGNTLQQNNPNFIAANVMIGSNNLQADSEVNEGSNHSNSGSPKTDDFSSGLNTITGSSGIAESSSVSEGIPASDKIDFPKDLDNTRITSAEPMVNSDETKPALAAEESSPPPDLAHADFDKNSFLSLIAASGLAPSLNEGWNSPGFIYSLGVQFNRTIRSNISFIGSASLNYRNGIDQSAAIDQLNYGFGSSVVQTKVNWTDMIGSDLRGGVVVSPAQRHHLVLTAGAQFLIDTRAEVILPASESSSKKWGYRDGFSKADFVLGSRYEYELCSNWRVFVQYSQGFGDMIDDAYFSKNGRQRNSSLMLGLHYLLRPLPVNSEGQYVKP